MNHATINEKLLSDVTRNFSGNFTDQLKKWDFIWGFCEELLMIEDWQTLTNESQGHKNDYRKLLNLIQLWRIITPNM